VWGETQPFVYIFVHPLLESIEQPLLPIDPNNLVQSVLTDGWDYKAWLLLLLLVLTDGYFEPYLPSNIFLLILCAIFIY
jgi:hypothetical protein